MRIGKRPNSEKYIPIKFFFYLYMCATFTDLSGSLLCFALFSFP